MRRLLALLSVMALMVAALAMPAAAAPVFTGGLVNVNVSGNNVQVPIGVAANVCNVSVAVVAEDVGTGDPVCTADADAIPVAFLPR